MNDYGLLNKSNLYANALNLSTINNSFYWEPTSTYNWRLVNEATLMMNLNTRWKTRDANNRFSASRYGYDGYYKTAAVTNCNYTSFTFAGFETVELGRGRRPSHLERAPRGGRPRLGRRSAEVSALRAREASRRPGVARVARAPVERLGVSWPLAAPPATTPASRACGPRRGVRASAGRGRRRRARAAQPRTRARGVARLSLRGSCWFRWCRCPCRCWWSPPEGPTTSMLVEA